ncbi:Intracellular heme transport protein HutX [Myxococcaceae bacterium]|jgi:putative heme utilization carrier protein HutX|nr:Intracellular heme transport protein HutX [Myxococcaceae bacterium]
MTLSETPPSASLDALREQLARNPGVILESIAEKHGVPLRTVVDCLPDEMRTEVPGRHFVAVLDEVKDWGPVTVIVHTHDGIFEFGGPLPPGSEGRGFYNLEGKTGFGGHLRANRCDTIVFLRRPFMGKQTVSLQFFNAEGGSMFKVFLGRDEKGELRSDQIERFDALERRLTGSGSA